MLRSLLFIMLFIGKLGYGDTFSDAVAAYDRQDYVEAYTLFSELMELGHIDATNNVAIMYQVGNGVPRDYVKAADLYLKAAKSGHVDAAFNYSTLLRLGVGVQKNSADAYAWGVIAARHGASDLVAYRDVLATKITPEEFAQGSQKAEEILMDFIQYEPAIGWLLPNNVRIASRETPIPKAISKVEKLTADGELTVIKNEAVQKITEENIHELTAPSYKAIMTTLPMGLNPYGYVMYRPLLNAPRHSAKQVLRPRRVVGERAVPIVEDLEVDTSLLPLFQSLSVSYNSHINDVIRAIQTLNPDAFEDDLPLRLKDSNARLKIPNYSQVKDL